MSAPRIAIVTVSDTRTEETDTSGKAIAEELAGFELLRRKICRDDPEKIAETVQDAAAEGDAVVVTGGTGIATRDQTYESVTALFDKELPGFGEAFRRLSWDEVGPLAILSRATAGTIGTSIVFLLPGSEKAVRLGVKKLVIPVVGHAADLLNGRTKHGL